MKNAPIVLNAGVTLARGNGGIDVSLTAMQSTSRHWIRIDEIRVWIDPGEPDANPPPSARLTDLGYIVDVALKAGRTDLTTGFIGTQQHPIGERISYIPVFLLGPRIYRRFSTIVNEDLQHSVFGTPWKAQNAYVWTLPRPLYLPPGTPLSAKFRRTSSLTGLDNVAYFPGDFTVEIAAFGQKLVAPPVTSAFCVPHLHAWSPRPEIDPATITANNQKIESGEAYRNLYQETLVLTRMTGGIASIGATSYGISWLAGDVATDISALWINDGDGKEVLAPVPPVGLYQITPPVGLVPMSALFMAKTNSFRINDRLKPNQVYRVAVGPVTANADNPFLPMIGLESFREVKP